MSFIRKIYFQSRSKASSFIQFFRPLQENAQLVIKNKLLQF